MIITPTVMATASYRYRVHHRDIFSRWETAVGSAEKTDIDIWVGQLQQQITAGLRVIRTAR